MELNSELECRVCRCGIEDQRPLFHPCNCSGSIGLVHQDCLEQWLAHSKKNTCELCGSNYQFELQYSENAPKRIPYILIFVSLIKYIFLKIVPDILRILLAIFVWIIFVPISTTCIYCTCIGRRNSILNAFNFHTVKTTITNGIVLDGVIALSLLILMSFTDFLRFHWIPNPVPVPPVVDNPIPNQMPMEPTPLDNLIQNHDNAEEAETNTEASNINDNHGISSEPHDPLHPDNGSNALHPDIASKSTAFDPTNHSNSSKIKYFETSKNIQGPQGDTLNTPVITKHKSSLELIHRKVPRTAPRNVSAGNPVQSTQSSNSFADYDSKIDLYLDNEYPSNASLAALGIGETTEYPPMMMMSTADEYHQDVITNMEDDNSMNYHNELIDSENKIESHFGVSWDSLDRRDDDEFDDSSIQFKRPEIQDSRTSSCNSEVVSILEHVPRRGHQSSHVDRSYSLVHDHSMNADSSREVDEARVHTTRNSRSIVCDIDEDHKLRIETVSEQDEMKRPTLTASYSESTWMLDSEDFNEESETSPNFIENLSNQDIVPPEVDPAVPMGEVNDNPPPNQPPAANNVNNNLNHNGNNIPREEVGMEIRLALFELLGLEGPLHIMFRHSFWILGFAAIYLTAIVSCPYFIGSLAYKLLKQRVPVTVSQQVWEISNQLIPSRLSAILTHMDTYYATHDPPLQFYDFLYIAYGFVTVISAVFFVHFVTTAIHSIIPQSFVKEQAAKLMTVVNRLSVVVKVAVLLIFRILMLPIMLGTIILWAILEILMPSLTSLELTEFFAINTVGVYSLAWVTGITFMLTMTISVLQLREVLHPQIFAKFIRPQEEHSELINSLINESGIVHLRRVFVSMVVYILLMAMLVVIPLIIVRQILFISTQKIHLELKFSYFAPELQLPLELLVCHVTFLSLLDRRKEMIGRMQHLWLVYACKHIGLTRYLLPLSRYRASVFTRNPANPKPPNFVPLRNRNRRAVVLPNPRLPHRPPEPNLEQFRQTKSPDKIKSSEFLKSNSVANHLDANLLANTTTTSSSEFPSKLTDPIPRVSSTRSTTIGSSAGNLQRISAVPQSKSSNDLAIAEMKMMNHHPTADHDRKAFRNVTNDDEMGGGGEDKEDVFFVEHPLRRPPLNWDIMGPHYSTRWAWGNEEPSAVEKNLAPRAVPTWLGIRCLVLILISQLLLNMITVSIMILPIVIGRFIFNLYQTPSSMHHDPVSFFCGLAIFSSFVSNLAKYPALFQSSRWRKKPSQTSPNISVYSVLIAVKVLCKWWMMIASIGFLLYFGGLFNQKDILTMKLSWNVSLLSLVQTWLSGFLTVHIPIILISTHGFAIRMDRLLQVGNERNDRVHLWAMALMAWWRNFKTNLFQGNWDQQALQLEVIEQLLISTGFKESFYGSLIVIGMSFTIATKISSDPSQYVEIDEMKFFSALNALCLIRIGHWIVKLIWLPIKNMSIEVYDKVWNDHYLIGRKLRNKDRID